MRRPKNPPVTVLSLGAGVQSCTLYLMAEAGVIRPMPVAAIFADTGEEPEHVYETIIRLAARGTIPIHTVYGRSNMWDDAGAIRAKENGEKWVKTVVPAFVRGNGGKAAMLTRQCTRELKIRPIQAEALRCMRRANASGVLQWIGISTDEADRAKPSGAKHIRNEYPLLDVMMSRHSCQQWLDGNGFGWVKKSACSCCPYRSNAEWVRLRRDSPRDFERACKMDERFRESKKTAAGRGGLPYLHRSLKPLREVDFGAIHEQDDLRMWGDECSGLCGT